MISRSQCEALLFSGTVFLSAALLFSVEPMIARSLAPLLGGAPAVWNTCLFFFQILLLAGYSYSHFVSRRLSIRGQRFAQIVLIALAAATLPVGIGSAIASKISVETPIASAFAALAVSVGLPFFALSTLAPLLQHWLAQRGRQPFFLYSASNAGSLLALLAYPILIEPTFGIARQNWLWSAFFLTLLPLVWWAGSPGRCLAQRSSEEPQSAAIPNRTRLAWIALAFIPSSLLQGVTSFLTADIASLPLLWIIPLSLYLLTFVIAFSDRAKLTSEKLDTVLALSTVALVLLFSLQALRPAWLLMLAHLAFFFIASLACHIRLAEMRPAPARLTEFYLWIAVGGAAGGLFNALLAPQIFSRVIEYPLVILLVPFVRIRSLPRTALERIWDLSIAILMLIAATITMMISRVLKYEADAPAIAVAFGLLTAICFFLKHERLRFALCVPAVFLGSAMALSSGGRTVHSERNFFGVLRVTSDGGLFHRLYHGTTIHGVAATDPARHCEPLSYYYRGGSFDQIWRFASETAAIKRVGAVGMGSGSVLMYAAPSQSWTFYEIDPAVIRLADDPRWFHFGACNRPSVNYVIGDARVRMSEAPARAYDFMIVDAFSSDSVPIHLLTREAFQIYKNKLAEGGLIAIHISSRSLNLEPVVVRVAAAEGFSVFRPGRVAPADNRSTFEALWLLLVKTPKTSPTLNNPEKWIPLSPSEETPLWTDDFSNLWSVIAFR